MHPFSASLTIPPPQLQDPNSNIIAFVRPTSPVRYPGIGDVHAELHFVRAAGAGVVVCHTVVYRMLDEMLIEIADAPSAHGHRHSDGHALPFRFGVQSVICISGKTDFLLYD